MARTAVLPSVFTAIDRYSAPVTRMGRHTKAVFDRVERSLRRTSRMYSDLGRASATAGIAILTPLGLGVNEAVKYEDALTDITKTTGLTGRALDIYSDKMLRMSTTTRSGIDELTRISIIGGQMGVAKAQLLGFVKAANIFNVALSDEFSGGTEQAISQVAKMVSLFDQTSKLDIGDAITKTGSVINNLGATSNATSENISSFILRVGGMPKALRPAITDVAALGAVLESSGVRYERGSSGFINLISRAGRHIDRFASQMGKTKKEAADLLNQNPLEFAKQFSETFRGMRSEKMEKILQRLNVNTLETKAVVGVLSEKGRELTKVQSDQNKVFKLGSDILNEYNVKNSSTAANIEKTKNRISRLVITASKGFLPVVNRMMDRLEPIIERFTDWANRNQALVGTIIKTVAVVGTLALALAAISFTVSAFSTALMFLVNPVGAVITAVGFLAVGIYSLTKRFDGLTASEKAHNAVLKRAMSDTIDQRAEVKKLFNQLRHNEEGTHRYRYALERLETISSGIVDKYELQTKSANLLNEAERELNKTLIQRAKIKANEDLIGETARELVKVEMEDQDGYLNKLTNGFFSFKQAGRRIELKEELEALELNLQKLNGTDGENTAEAVVPKSSNLFNIEDIIGKRMNETIKVIFENAPEGMRLEDASGKRFTGPVVSLTNTVPNG